MPTPTILQNDRVRLEPLTLEHAESMAEVVRDGNLWELVITSAPTPDKCSEYIQTAIDTPDRIAFAVIDKATNSMVGTTSYHDILPAVKRLEIGYTFYGKSHWRSYVNTKCKLLLLMHAFETLDYQTVGWRTDNLNTQSQRAIERLGAKKDGVIRGHKRRKDGTVRDTVMYSMLQSEWADAKANLLTKLAQY